MEVPQAVDVSPECPKHLTTFFICTGNDLINMQIVSMRSRTASGKWRSDAVYKPANTISMEVNNVSETEANAK